MNFKYIITSLMVLLATFFMVSSSMAGTVDGLNRSGDIQVLGITNALSAAPYEYPPVEVRFETAIEKVRLATEDTLGRVDGDIQVLGMANAISPEHYELTSDVMGNDEYIEFCSEERLPEITDSTISTGGTIQVFGLANALMHKC